MFRTLREEPLYLEQLSAIGTIKYLDAALSVVTMLISRRAEAFQRVPNTASFYIAETAKFVREDSDVPPLRILFSIENDYEVSLRGIMVIPAGESDFQFD